MRRLGRLLLGVAGLALGLACVELGLVWAHGSAIGPWEAVPEIGSPFVFRLKGDADDPGVGVVHVRAVARRPAPGVRRVLSYGDSIAAGYGIDPAASYSALLERGLSGSDTSRIESRSAQGETPRIEVLAMARGHSPSIYAQHLRVDVPRLSPDAVLVEIELANDLPDEAHVRNAPPAADGLPARVIRARYVVGFDGQLLAPLAWRGAWFERTRVYAALGHTLGRLRDRLGPNPIFADDSNEAYYARRFDRHRLTRDELEAARVRLFDGLSAMHGYLQRRDVPLAVVVVPSRYAFEDGPLRAHGRRLVAQAHRELDRRGIPALALLGAMEAAGGTGLYLDFCHPTAAGHAVIAEALGEALDAGLLGPGLTRP